MVVVVVPFFAKSSKSLTLMACLMGPKVRTTFSAPNALVFVDNMLALAPKNTVMPIDTKKKLHRKFVTRNG